MGSQNRGFVSVKWALGIALGIALASCQSAKNEAGAAGNAATNNVAPTAGSSAPPPVSATGGQAAPAQSGSGGSATTQSGSSAPTGSAGSGMMAQASGGSNGASAAGSVAAGTGGTMMVANAGSDGSAGSAGAQAGTGGSGSSHDDLGKGDGSDVITIGDSWMQIVTNGGGIEGALDRAGTMYRHYAIPGTTLINGDIPQQYQRAKAANPNILTVIMTGGGNDIMFSNGCATKESCTMAVQMIADALNDLWTTMAGDGVKDVIYIEYSKNAGTAPSDTRPDTAPIPMICTTGKIGCHSLDTTPYVGPTDTIDGIHPTQPAADMIAKAVLDLMEQNGIRR